MENRFDEEYVGETVDLLSGLSLRMSLEDFMARLLEVALKILPDFNRGSVILEIDGKWKYVAWKGYSDVLRSIEVDPERFLIPSTEEPVVIEKIFWTTSAIKSPKVNEALRQAGTMDVQKTIAVGIFTEERPIGAFFLDSTKDVDVTPEMKKTVKAFGRLASIFVSMKIHQERERGYQKGIIMAMIRTMEMRDPYTVGHSERVARFAVDIAKSMNLDIRDVDRIYWGSIVHDIGKMGVPEDILMKPTKLTPLEYELVKRHPILGEQTIAEFPWLNDLKTIVRSHHERWDGKGYPDGLKGEEIPFEARIVAVADAFDAMTSRRAYRKALTFEEALKEIYENAGTQFDPYVARKAIECLKKKLNL